MIVVARHAVDQEHTRRMIHDRRCLLPSLMLCLCLTGVCLAPRATATPADWTILVYGHADHNLTPSLIIDMEEMEAAGSAPGFNLVVQADFDANAGAERLRGLPTEYAAGLTRFLIQPDNDRSRITSPAVGQLPESNNMDSPNTLMDFIRWGVQTYPARRYGLVFWNHGGQWTGFGGDSQDGTLASGAKGILTTRQIRDALQAAGPGVGVNKWEFIGFDTCLMGGVEILADFAGLADVFIACPEIDYGDGWDYAASFAYLKNNRGVTAAEFGRRETEHWQAHHFQPQNQTDLALAAHAAYDLVRFSDVQSKLFTFATSLKTANATHHVALARHRSDTTGYYITGRDQLGQSTQFIDIGEMARRISRDAGVGTELTAAASDFASSVEALVLGKSLGSTKQDALGLSIYYPVAGVQQEAAYEALTLSQTAGATWLDYLRAVATGAAGSAPPVVTQGPPPSGSADIVFITPTPPGAPAVTPRQIDVQIESPDAARISAAIAVIPQPNVILYLTEVVGSLIPGPGGYRILWNGGLPVLAGQDPFVAPYLGSFFDPYGSGFLMSIAEYIIPDFFEPEFSIVFYVILVSEIDDQGNGEVIAILDAQSDELAPEPIEVYPGDYIRPVYIAELRQGPDPDSWPIELVPAEDAVEITENGLADLQIQTLPVQQGTYYMELSVLDLFDNESTLGGLSVNVGGPTFAQPPRITAQPQSQSVAAGNRATFTVAATGDGPLNYQWRLAGENIHGATQPTLELVNVSEADAGLYTVLVSGPGGSVASVEARLTITGGGQTRPSLEVTGLNAQGHFGLKFNGTAGVTYIVESSEDLKSWTEVHRGAPVNGTVTYYDANTRTSKNTFFRVRQ